MNLVITVFIVIKLYDNDPVLYKHMPQWITGNSVAMLYHLHQANYFSSFDTWANIAWLGCSDTHIKKHLH